MTLCTNVVSIETTRNPFSLMKLREPSVRDVTNDDAETPTRATRRSLLRSVLRRLNVAKHRLAAHEPIQNGIKPFHAQNLSHR